MRRGEGLQRSWAADTQQYVGQGKLEMQARDLDKMRRERDDVENCSLEMERDFKRVEDKIKSLTDQMLTIR